VGVLAAVVGGAGLAWAEGAVSDTSAPVADRRAAQDSGRILGVTAGVGGVAALAGAGLLAYSLVE
jgi:hypothetical protein